MNTQNLTIKYRPLDDLIPYARNSRTHSDTQVAQIAASIKEFGWTNPVLVDETGGIIAGHGRVMAARKLNETEVPTITLLGLTDTQKRAYVIADNKLALNAGWDEEMLVLELSELELDGIDLNLLGFNDAEIAKLKDIGEDIDADAEWTGMPEFDQGDKTSDRSIIVHFENSAMVAAFAKLVGQNITDKTKSIWYPAQVRMDTESKRYGS